MNSDSVAETAVSEPLSAPERSRLQTRERLVLAGTELFAEQGLHRTTTVQIARRAGVAAGTFYLHFRDKHALFREIVFDALARVRARMAGARRGHEHDPAAAVRASLGELLRFAEENGALVRVLFGRGHEAGELADAVVDELVPGVAARLRERLGDGADGLDPSVAAQALVAMWTRVVAWWVEDPARAPRDAVIETLVRLHPASRAPGA